MSYNLRLYVSPVWKDFKSEGKDERLFGPKNNTVIYTAFVIEVFESKNPDLTVQESQRSILRVARTTPEILSGWSYDTGCIVDKEDQGSMIAKFWFAANLVLGSVWVLKQPKKLKKITSEKAKGILVTSKSNEAKQKSVKMMEGSGGYFSMKSTCTISVVTPMEDQVVMNEPRAFKTFAQIKIEELPAKGDLNAIFKKRFIDALEILTLGDKSLVLYQFPKARALKAKKAWKPLKFENKKRYYMANKPIKTTSEIKHYVNKSPWIKEGAFNTLIMYVGTALPFEEVTSEEVEEHLQKACVEVWKNPVQAAESSIVAWLAMADSKSTDTGALTEVLQNHPRLSRYPVAAAIAPFRLDNESVKLKFTDPNAVKVVVVKTTSSPSIQAKVLKQLRAIYNKHDMKHAKEKPQLASFTAVPYYADRGNPPCGDKTKAKVMSTLRTHIRFVKELKYIPLDNVIDVNILVTLDNGYTTTLEVLLMCMRTRKHWAAPLISQVGRDRDGRIQVVVHKNNYQEASSVTEHLYILLKAKFGENVKEFFTDTALIAAQGSAYDSETMRIKEEENNDDDYLPDITFYTKPELLAAKERGLDIEESDEDDDSMNYEFLTEGKDLSYLGYDEKEDIQYEFDIENIFQMEPTVKMSNQFDDGSNTYDTGLTNATAILAEESEDSNNDGKPSSVQRRSNEDEDDY